MTNYKYQEAFAQELTESWLNGNKSHVRSTIRNLKNKAQAAFIAAGIAHMLGDDALEFVIFIHPNNQ